MQVPPESLRVMPRPPAPHQSNRLYDVWAGERHLVAKEYLKVRELMDAPRREFRALELVAPLDVAPRPVLFCMEHDTALGPLVVYEFMDGEMWDRRRPSARDMERLAEVWLRIHGISAEGLWVSRGSEQPPGEILEECHRRFAEYSEWARARGRGASTAADLCLSVLDRCAPAVAELEDLPPRMCFCRSDARFANVIERPNGRLGLVDWEDSGLRDPARELADLRTHANQEDLIGPDAWRAFVEHYAAGRGNSDPTLLRRAELYVPLFAVFWLSVLIDRGLHMAGAGKLAGWTVNGLEPNVRLRRYLARALAWPDADFSPCLQTLGAVTFFPPGTAD